MAKKDKQQEEHRRHFVMSIEVFAAILLLLVGAYFGLEALRTDTPQGASETVAEANDINDTRINTLDDEIAESSDPESTAALLRSKAAVFENDGNYQEAAKAIEESLELAEVSDLARINSYLRLATLYALQSEFERAVEWLDATEDIDQAVRSEFETEINERRLAYQSEQQYDSVTLCETEEGQLEPC